MGNPSRATLRLVAATPRGNGVGGLGAWPWNTLVPAHLDFDHIATDEIIRRLRMALAALVEAGRIEPRLAAYVETQMVADLCAIDRPRDLFTDRYRDPIVRFDVLRTADEPGGDAALDEFLRQQAVRVGATLGEEDAAHRDAKRKRHRRGGRWNRAEPLARESLRRDGSITPEGQRTRPELVVAAAPAGEEGEIEQSPEDLMEPMFLVLVAFNPVNLKARRKHLEDLAERIVASSGDPVDLAVLAAVIDADAQLREERDGLSDAMRALRRLADHDPVVAPAAPLPGLLGNGRIRDWPWILCPAEGDSIRRAEATVADWMVRTALSAMRADEYPESDDADRGAWGLSRDVFGVLRSWKYPIRIEEKSAEPAMQQQRARIEAAVDAAFWAGLAARADSRQEE